MINNIKYFMRFVIWWVNKTHLLRNGIKIRNICIEWIGFSNRSDKEKRYLLIADFMAAWKREKMSKEYQTHKNPRQLKFFFSYFFSVSFGSSEFVPLRISAKVTTRVLKLNRFDWFEFVRDQKKIYTKNMLVNSKIYYISGDTKETNPVLRLK